MDSTAIESLRFAFISNVIFFLTSGSGQWEQSLQHPTETTLLLKMWLALPSVVQLARKDQISVSMLPPR